MKMQGFLAWSSITKEADRSEGKGKKARCNEWMGLNGQLISVFLFGLALSAEAYVGSKSTFSSS
jgi:hypothetical protein